MPWRIAVYAWGPRRAERAGADRTVQIVGLPDTGKPVLAGVAES